MSDWTWSDYVSWYGRPHFDEHANAARLGVSERELEQMLDAEPDRDLAARQALIDHRGNDQ